MSDAAAPDPFGTGLPLDTQVSRPRPGTVLLAVDGEIDTLTAARLQAGLDEAVEASRADGSGVVVDLSGVTFLASSGLAVLIGGARRLAGFGTRLHLVAASRAVTRPLQVTGADALFDIHDDVPSALQEAKGAGASQGAPASEERTAPESRPSHTEAKGAGASPRAPASEERTAPESRPSHTEAKGAGASQGAPASEERTAPESRPSHTEAKGAGASPPSASQQATAPRSRPSHAAAPPPGVAPPTGEVGR